MDRQQEEPTQEFGDLEQYYGQLTPYDVMRMQNCKSSRFVNRETYPSIRPPVSKCSLNQTKTWLADAVENIGCVRPFENMHNDYLLDAWKQSPNKETLSCYGLGSDAIVFNQVLLKCLNKVNGVERCKKSKSPKKSEKKRAKPKGSYVLNRNVLKCTINKMPTVLSKTNPSKANTILYCPEPEDPENPFIEDEPIIPLQRALDMEKPIPKPKHGLRRRHMYCDRQCGIPQNKCTDYEWRKYKQNPKPYEVAFESEMAEMECPEEPEPQTFDELYTELISCFQKTEVQHPSCNVYEKCCARPSERLSGIQGCGEEKLPKSFPCTC
ncbi:uncharacterized protein LOC6562111 [Drosophila grimshawi]|uniref:uncharacterized protein LOC6562111 n=1 Tax=Drosophila grimshawi TaxID=7222 RepID=UPI001C9368B3|nr:uncharacterized protein LOC6562111 [Drosophila grimshawi]